MCLQDRKRLAVNLSAAARAKSRITSHRRKLLLLEKPASYPTPKPKHSKLSGFVGKPDNCREQELSLPISF